MKPNVLSITFWFNIFLEQESFIDLFNTNLKGEFTEYKFYDEETNNLYAPRVVATNDKSKDNLSFSAINLQYNMETVDIDRFCRNCLKIYDLLTDNHLTIMHTSLYTEIEVVNKEALEIITKNILTSKINSDDLVDVTLRLGKKYEDIFYKIVTLMNKRQLEIPKKLDNFQRVIPLPLISWQEASIKDEVLNIAYEINDKLSFDTEKNYHTESSYLNKMLYIFKNDLEDDITSLLKKGQF